MTGTSVIDNRFAGGAVELSVEREILDQRSADGLVWLTVASCPLRKSGGGQPEDTGIISTPDGRTAVICATKKGPNAAEVAITLPSPFALGERVTITVDSERRFGLSRAHSFTHVAMACLKREIADFGSRGATISGDSSSVGLYFEGRDFTAANIRQALENAKKNIEVDRPVSVRYANSLADAAKLPLFRVDHTLALRGKIRLIEIAGLDLNPCSGTHLASLCSIGTGFGVKSLEQQGGVYLLKIHLPGVGRGGL